MRSSGLILVGYTTCCRDDCQGYMPDFQPRKGTTDPVKQAEQIAVKQETYARETMLISPYVAQLYRVCLIPVDNPEVQMFEYSNMSGSVPAEVGAAAGAFINDRYRDEFEHDGTCVEDPVRMVGFDIRRFSKFLGLECAEAGYEELPPCMWYGSDNRELWDIFLPTPEAKKIGLELALKRLSIDQCFKGQIEPGVYQPHVSPKFDVLIAAYALRAMNLFPLYDVVLGDTIEMLEEDLEGAAQGTTDE